jgi:hypothetical protein
MEEDAEGPGGPSVGDIFDGFMYGLKPVPFYLSWLFLRCLRLREWREVEQKQILPFVQDDNRIGRLDWPGALIDRI